MGWGSALLAKKGQWKEVEFGFDSVGDWDLPRKMRGGVGKKLALAARGLCKHTAAGMVGVGFSVFAPRIAPLLGLGALLADDEGPKRVLFWGVRLLILRMGRTPPEFLDIVDGGDEHGAAREPLPFSIDALFVALRPFSGSSAVLLGEEGSRGAGGAGGERGGWEKIGH